MAIDNTTFSNTFKLLQHAWRDKRAAEFGAREPPKGSMILKKNSHAGCKLQAAGLEGLEDWRLNI